MLLCQILKTSKTKIRTLSIYLIFSVTKINFQFSVNTVLTIQVNYLGRIIFGTFRGSKSIPTTLRKSRGSTKLFNYYVFFDFPIFTVWTSSNEFRFNPILLPLFSRVVLRKINSFFAIAIPSFHALHSRIRPFRK